MTHVPVICPVCGAKIPDAPSVQAYICPFCHFERRIAITDQQPPVEDIPKRVHKEHVCELSNMTLPFQDDLNQYFRQKFQKLAPGETWYLSVPVKRVFQKAAPLSGQINFFTSKNIMFLLEQHGFKMTWRQNRFASILRIIARKC